METRNKTLGQGVKCIDETKKNTKTFVRQWFWCVVEVRGVELFLKTK